MIKILNWSEVWALFIPLAILFLNRKKKQPSYLKPVIVYLWIALLVNLSCDIIDNWTRKHSDSFWLKNNNYLYNIHSIIRFICFCAFFELLKQPFLTKIKKYIPVISLVFIVINFLFFEKFFRSQTISSRLFAIEAGILLFYCLQYYLFKLQEEKIDKKEADFWVVIGLSIYVVFNFPFFLLYTSLSPDNQSLWWNFHNISYIILCIFIAKAFYVPGNK